MVLDKNSTNYLLAFLIGTITLFLTSVKAKSVSAEHVESYCESIGGTINTANLFTEADGGTFGEGTAADQTFELSPSNLTTYIYDPDYPPQDGEYTVSTQTTVEGFGSWHPFSGHTTGTATDRFLVINANNQIVDTEMIQSSVISGLTPNTNYTFTAYVLNTVEDDPSGHIDPNVSFGIDLTGIDDDDDGTIDEDQEIEVRFSSGDIPESTEPTWNQFAFLFNTGSATSARFVIRNNKLGGFGNDLAIDDVALEGCDLPSVGNLEGTLYYDSNSNDNFDSGEAGLSAGLTVRLIDTQGTADTNDDVIVSRQANSDGAYSFLNIPASSNYQVLVPNDDGLGNPIGTTNPLTGISVTGGSTTSDQNFGYDSLGSLTKVFDPDTIVPTEVSTLTFNITNIAGNPARSDINFTDEFPTNVIIADNDIENTCNGTLTNSSGTTIDINDDIDDTGITLTGGSLASGETNCQIIVKVTSNRDVASTTTYTNDSSNISNENNINAENLDDDLIVNPFPVSPLAGNLIINEVLYAQTRNGASGNDEFIELFNASNGTINLSGLKLFDGNLLATGNPNADDENFAGSDKFYTFGNGITESGNLSLEPGQYAVVWIGSQSNSVNNATGATFQAWLNVDPKLNNNGDDVWLYDANTELIDYIAYGRNTSSSTAINARPDSEPGLWSQWDNTYEDKLDKRGSTSITGQSISLTPNGIDGNTSACWEKTTIDESDPDSASVRCANFLETIDSDTSIINSTERTTSVGTNNNGNPNLILVKRITNLVPNPNSIDFTTVVDDGDPDSEDDNPNWENNFLQGQINVSDAQPGDEVEYTIYFLSNGTGEVSNVKICDVVPDNMSFVENNFGNDIGISLFFDGTTEDLSNIANDDQGQFYSPNTEPPTFCQKIDSSTGNLVSVDSNNNTGAVVVELDNPLPSATGSGTPSDSYGYIRFRVQVQ
ncbi:lamin tail domain-containing protein [Pleurocapsa sp. PCC 7319]|uniref:lamin tail domain-containing protein n=1 Tax=Pleurocapsa sp. PCC 7319 TaxID=118161 RepID=UPI000345AAE6|nr:lamin tail domain-containing protein [Pleurocapsa sp. PCC 7319]